MVIVSACAVADRSADRRGEVDRHLRDVRAAQIVDDDVVGAAERVELDGLDVIQIHGDVGDVAGEQHAPAIGRDVDFLG